MRILEGQEAQEALMWLERTAEVASRSLCHRALCGSVIVKDGELLAEGFNVFNDTFTFIQTNLLYTRPTGTNNLVYNTPFGTGTESSSTNYRERQIQFAARFQF